MHSFQHFNLLLRCDRALNLRRAIERTVRPGARVLDAGCGAGLLSFWAAQCGAGQVVGVDLEGLDLARELAEENAIGDSLRFVEGDLRDLQLDGGANRFDVILAMIYLNDPRRDERQSDLVYTLRDRHLSAAGLMVPDRVRYVACACDWPSQDHATRVSGLVASVRDLEGRYGLCFQALRERLVGRPWNSFFPPRRADGRLHLDNARILSERAVFAEISYNGPRSSYPETFELVIGAPGIFNTVLWTQELWFEDLLLFSNDAVSWVAEPCLVEERARCAVRISDTWRRQNVVTVMR